jgi:hypothetical protein
MTMNDCVSPSSAPPRDRFVAAMIYPTVRSAMPNRQGYAFEAALCLIESQSPRLRPARATPGQATQELVGRIALVSDLLKGVHGQLDAADTQVLRSTAARVTSELIAVLGDADYQAAA